MSESLLDSAIMVSRNALLDLGDSQERRDLATRLGLLERASWAIGLASSPEEQVVKLVKVVLHLRDEIVDARREVLGIPKGTASEPARNYLAG